MTRKIQYVLLFMLVVFIGYQAINVQNNTHSPLTPVSNYLLEVNKKERYVSSLLESKDYPEAMLALAILENQIREKVKTYDQEFNHKFSTLADDYIRKYGKKPDDVTILRLHAEASDYYYPNYQSDLAFIKYYQAQVAINMHDKPQAVLYLNQALRLDTTNEVYREAYIKLVKSLDK